MESKLEDRFRKAAEFQSRVRALGNLNYWMGLERGMAPEGAEDLDGLVADLRSAGVELGADFDAFEPWRMVFTLSEVAASLSKVRISVSPSLKVSELASGAVTSAVRFDSSSGFPEEELLKSLAGRRFRLEVAWRDQPAAFPEARTLGELLAAMATVIDTKLKTPKQIGLQERIWNPARQFNPKRVLDLRISGLEWDVLMSRGPVLLLCSGVDEALENPSERHERRALRLPSHPTLRPPWRVMYVAENGELWEESLGISPRAAWERYVEGVIDIRAFPGQPGPQLEGLRNDLLGRFDRPSSQDHIVLDASTNPRGEVQTYVIRQDHPDLPVVGRNELASWPGRDGAKAREIWFERFRDVISPALPDAVEVLRFDLEERPPASIFRTFVASLGPSSDLPRPTCPECGESCDRVVHLDFRHHPQRPALPGSSLLLFTCSNDNYTSEMWQFEWLQRDEVTARIPGILASVERIMAGPAYRDLEYLDSQVDREAFNRDAERWAAFDNSWEKSYFMFATPGTKVGGAPSWIQGDCTPDDRDGRPMIFIGQVGCYELIEIGDSGEAYLFHSLVTGETRVVTQCF